MQKSNRQECAYWQEEQLEGEDISLLAVAGSNLPELAPCLEGLLDTALDITVDLMPEGRLQKQLPAWARAQCACQRYLQIQPVRSYTAGQHQPCIVTG